MSTDNLEASPDDVVLSPPAPRAGPPVTDAAAAGGVPGASEPPRPATAEVLDVAALRHPYEQPRFAVAAAAAIVIVGAGAVALWAAVGLVPLLLIAAGAVHVVALVWVSLQVARSRLLGRAVRVTDVTFPELHRAVVSVRQRLGYDGRVEVFVIDRASAPATTTSYLGTRVILVEGDLVAELTEPENRAQLTFLLATHYGALKAAHDVWLPAFLVLAAVRALRVIDFLVAPWLRATVYTGDQIAMATCGRFDESIVALNRMTVGGRSARSVGVAGVLEQAAVVRRGWLTRLQQLYAVEPHLTNRYLNLLGFADVTAADQLETFRRSLPVTTAALVEELTAQQPHRRGSGRRSRTVPVTVAAACAVVVLLAAVVTWADLEPTSPPAPTPVPSPIEEAPPDVLLGRLDPSSGVVVGTVEGGGVARAELVARVGALHSFLVTGDGALDPVLAAFSPAGEVMAQDADTPGDGEAYVELLLSAGEEVQLAVAGYDGGAGSFEVAVVEEVPVLGRGESVVVLAEEGRSTRVVLAENEGLLLVRAEPRAGEDPLLRHVAEDGFVWGEDDDGGGGLASELWVDAAVSDLLDVTLLEGAGEVLVTVD